MTPSLDSLRALVAIGETGSFTDAARRLNSTQSTISHQIRRLEAQMGRKLIHRTTRTAALNADGEAAFAHAKRVLERMEQFTDLFGQGGVRGALRFGLAEDCFSGRVAGLLRAFQIRHPEVRLDIAIAPSARLVAGLHANRLDLALLRGVGPGEGEPLWQEPLVWAGRAEAGPVPLVLLDPPCLYRDQIVALFRKHDIAHKIVATCSAHAVLRQVVSSGIGVTAMAQSDLPEGAACTLPLPELPMVETRLIAPPQCENPAALRLMEMLRAAV